MGHWLEMDGGDLSCLDSGATEKEEEILCCRGYPYIAVYLYKERIKQNMKF
jgi:hypothetical protein